MNKKIFLLQFLILQCMTASVQIAYSQNSSHPLDPLTWQEYWTVLETLQETGNLNVDTRFSHINLVQPDKKSVWNRNGNTTLPRTAFATVHQGTDPSGFRNSWGCGISGLTIVADMHTMEILRVVDEGIVPVSDTNIDFDVSAIPDVIDVPGPFFVHQPTGAGFSIDGHVVEWQKWTFHDRPDHRVGMVISAVTYSDDENERPVLYEGFLSEIFVPYMNPIFGWYPRNFIDLGEYTAGGFTNPLLRGSDAPDYAHYMDGLFNAR